jgi:hypothetical protein
LNTPVVFIIFNRPDVTAKTFREIARARPRTLLVIQDGPRRSRPGEADLCAAARRVVSVVDWECDVRTLFSDRNSGPREQLASGLDWAFAQVEEAIIFEHDCLPDPSFFPFCAELLERYRDDPRVMSISGNCFVDAADRPAESYYFSHLPSIWGWATWRRAWQSYDRTMAGWPQFRRSAEFARILPLRSTRRHYRHELDQTFAGRLDTWDYQWTFATWRRQGLSALPTRNLVRNIGFGPDATNTRYHDPALEPPLESIEFPLRHPPSPPAVRFDAHRRWLDQRYRLLPVISRRCMQLLQSVRQRLSA